MSRMVGGTLGIAVLGAFIGRRGQADFVQSLGDGLMVGAGVAAVGAIVAWRLVSPTLADPPASPPPPAGEIAAPPAQAARETSVGSPA